MHRIRPLAEQLEAAGGIHIQGVLFFSDARALHRFVGKGKPGLGREVCRNLYPFDLHTCIII